MGKHGVFFLLYLEASENFKHFLSWQLPLSDCAVRWTYSHDTETTVAERLGVQFS